MVSMRQTINTNLYPEVIIEFSLSLLRKNSYGVLTNLELSHYSIRPFK